MCTFFLLLMRSGKGFSVGQYDKDFTSASYLKSTEGALKSVFSPKSTHGITSRDCKWGAYQEQGLSKVIKLHSSKHRKLFDRFCETTILKWLKWVLDSTKSISAVPKKHGFNWNVFKMIMLCNKVQLHNVLKATLSVCWPDKVKLITNKHSTPQTFTTKKLNHIIQRQHEEY